MPEKREQTMTDKSALIDRQALIDLIEDRLTAVYHCTRVWEAWQYGTMSDDDFVEARGGDLAPDIADAVLSLLSALPTPAPTMVDERGDTIGEGWLLDSEGRRLIGASHHYTAASIKALIWELKALEDPRMTTKADFENRDWRAWCGILHRVMSGLASEVPLAPDSASDGHRIVDSDVEGED